PARSERYRDRYLLAVIGSVTGGQLRVSWRYNTERYHPDTITRLAAPLLAALRALLPSEHARPSGRALIPPGSVPYPLAPLQQEILRACRQDRRRGIYIPQWHATLQGALDIAAFIRAWQTMLDRHAGLRATFHADGDSNPIQVFHAHAALPWAV